MKRQFLRFFSQQDWEANQRLQVGVQVVGGCVRVWVTVGGGILCAGGGAGSVHAGFEPGALSKERGVIATSEPV